MDAIRNIASRLVGGVVVAAGTWLSAKTGIEVLPQETAEVASLIVGGLFILYGIVHKAVDNKINPADAADSRLAVKSQIETGARPNK